MPLIGRHALLAAGSLFLAGCSSTPRPAPPAPASSGAGAGYVGDVLPFPVLDSTGRSLDLAFLGGLNTPRPQLLDADGDGDLDLVLQEYGGRLMLFANEGLGADSLPIFRLRSRAWLGLNIGEWSRFVDLDGDGLPDAFGELPFSYLRFWHNTGTRAEPAFVASPDSVRDTDGRAVFADRQNIPQIVDLDCDGKLDLFIGRISGTILQYTLDTVRAGAPVFRLLTERFQDLEIITGQGSLHGANTMAFADVDGDGDLDLLWGDFFEAGLLLFENVGSCRAPRISHSPVRFPPRDPIVTSGYNAPAIGDLTGDGRPDLVVGVLGGAYDPNATTIDNLWLYTRAASGDWVRRTSRLLPEIDVGSESVPALVDLDGDGDLDLLLGSKIAPDDRRTGRLYWLENTGTPTAPAFRFRGALPMRGQFHYAPAAGDLDGDGRPDLVLGSFGPRLAYWRNAGGRDGPRFELVDSALVTVTRGSHTSPALGDLDGDGDLDLVVGRASGYLSYFRNDGTPASPRFTLVSDEWMGIRPGRRSAPCLVDIDGDGDLDLLVGTDDGGLTLWRNVGSRTEPRFGRDEGFRLDLPPLSAAAAGDLDGDGRPELIVGNGGGGVLFFRSR